jgi:hypothetical protein
MAQRQFVLIVTVESKDEWEGGVGHLPSGDEVARRIHDEAHYSTRGNWELPWMVTKVREP